MAGLSRQFIAFLSLSAACAGALASDTNALASHWDYSIVPKSTLPVTLGDISVMRFEEPGKQNSPWSWNVWGKSYHMKRPTLLNERNYGLGIRRSFGDGDYAEFNVARNSFRGIAASASLGAEYHLASW